MVILHTETLKKWGGQQNRVLTEAIGLSKRGHGVVVACHRGSMLAQRAKEAGIKVYEVNMVKQAYPVTILKLTNIIKKEGVDIVSTHSSVDSWAGGISALLTRRRFVRFKHNLNRVKTDIPTRFIYSLPDRFITVNDTAASVLLKTGFIKEEKIKRVYGAIEPEKFNPSRFSDSERRECRRSLGIPEDALVLGNTSGFTEIKGQRYLLEAVNSLFETRRNLFLLLAGRVAKKEKIFGLVKPEFHNRIVLPGLYADIPLLLSIMDLFVFPSTVEAFGNSLIEAMAMERAVLVSDLPSFREFMTDGKDGIFFEKANGRSLLDALRVILDNPDEWERLGKNARKTVTERFLPGRMIDETERVYLELINKWV